MLVQIKFSDRDAANPKTLAILDQNGWEAADNEDEPGWWQIGVAFPSGASDERDIARQVVEPFLNAGIQPLKVRPIILPLMTRIGMTARAISREDADPTEANRIYAILDELSSPPA
jgi:hypothetical protein